MTILGSTLVIAVLSAAIAVEGSGQRGCPTARAVERELERRGSQPPERGWSVVLSAASPDQAGAALHLQLLDARRQAVFSRVLALRPADCPAAARAVALVVERYFRELRSAKDPSRPAFGSGTGLDRDPEAEPTSSPLQGGPRGPVPGDEERSPTGELPTSAAVPPAPRGPGRRSAEAGLTSRSSLLGPGSLQAAPGMPVPRLLLSLGPAVTGDGEGSPSVGAALAAQARLWRWLGAGLGVLVPGVRRVEQIAQGATQGRARARGVPLRGRLLASRPGRHLLVEGGIEGGVLIERAHTESLPRNSAGWRAVSSAGATLGAGLVMAQRWRVTADVYLHRTVHGRAFAVEGVGRVLAPSDWRVGASLQIGWAMRP